MKPTERRDLEKRLLSFVGPLFASVGRIERRTALTQYVMGLLLEGGRKSLQPMAERLSGVPEESDALRQRLQQAVGTARWPEGPLRQQLTQALLQSLPGLEALIVDDTGFPKKGRWSPGVGRQYSGTLGRIDNCQTAVSLHLAGPHGSAAIAMRLFLLEAWDHDDERRRRAQIPEGVHHQPKWQMALTQLDEALSWGVPRFVTLADSGYGDCTAFRRALRERGLPYVMRIEGKTGVWAPGTGPIPPEQRVHSGRGRPIHRYQDGEHKPVSTLQLVMERGRASCREVRWAEGTKGPQTGRFGALRLCTSRGHANGLPPGPEEWLLYEWRDDDDPRLWLSSLPADTPLERLVYLAKLRWRVERDYQEMKGELGLDHFEGRTWQGFHHHATLCLIAHAFLAIQRAHFPPQDTAMDAPAGPGRSTAGPDAPPRTLPPLPEADPTRSTQRAQRSRTADVTR